MPTHNNLYPVFLKTGQLRILIVGGGYVAEEKLQFLLKSSPDAQLSVLAPYFRPATLELMEAHDVLRLDGTYRPEYLRGYHLVIGTTDKPEVNARIFRDCRERDTLVNIADNPTLCDFYMGGIVTKGQVKIAISTNGSSPTLAKRLRQFFEQVLPDDLDALATYLRTYRDRLKGDFESKVTEMNKMTQKLLDN